MTISRLNSLASLSRYIAVAAAGLMILAVAAPTPAWAGEELKDKKLARLWKAKCSACHGSDGKAETDQGKIFEMGSMTNPAWQAERTDERMREAILNGFTRTTKNGATQVMPSFKSEVAPEQVDILIAFIRGKAT